LCNTTSLGTRQTSIHPWILEPWVSLRPIIINPQQYTVVGIVAFNTESVFQTWPSAASSNQ